VELPTSEGLREPCSAGNLLGKRAAISDNSDSEFELKKRKSEVESTEHWRKTYATKQELAEVQNQVKDIQEKYTEFNKKLDAILKIQDFILNEIPDLSLDKSKILKSSPTLRGSDMVNKVLAGNTALRATNSILN
jgi:hypothetical protein